MSITRTRIDKVIELLCAHFPNCFVQFERRRRPLKLRIDCDITERLGDQIDRKLLSVALRFYVRNVHYGNSQQAGAPRIDLDGNQVGEVSEEDALTAAADVRARRTAHKARDRAAYLARKAKREADTAAFEARKAAREVAARTTVKPAVETAPPPPPAPSVMIWPACARQRNGARKQPHDVDDIQARFG